MKYIFTRHTAQIVVFTEGTEVISVKFKTRFFYKVESSFFIGNKSVLQVSESRPFFMGIRKYTIVSQQLPDRVEIVSREKKSYLVAKGMEFNVEYVGGWFSRLSYLLYRNGERAGKIDVRWQMDYPVRYDLDMEDTDGTVLYQLIRMLLAMSIMSKGY